MSSGRAVRTVAKTTVDKLAAAVQKALRDYADDATITTKEVVQEVARKGAQAVRKASASAFGSGKYSRGWKATMEVTRLGATGVIHNTTPGLPHLLENGHANRGGGRTPGRPHIAPVEEELVKDFPKELEERL